MRTLLSALAALLLALPAFGQLPCDFDAQVTRLPGGTPGTNGVPLLATKGAPLVGYPFSMDVSGGEPFAHGCVVWSVFETPFDIPWFGATGYPGMPYLHVSQFDLDDQGRSPMLVERLAVEPELCGATVVAQGMFVDSGALNGFAFTDAVRLEFGPASAGAPTVDPLASPTMATSITVSGSGVQAGNTIRIEGGDGVVETTLDASGLFTVDVPLRSNAANQLFVRELFPGGAVGPATTRTVVQDSTPPEIRIEFPTPGQVLSTDSINVVGTVADKLSGFMGLTVVVNGQSAQVNVGVGTNGSFDLAELVLAPGVQTVIQATATDELGNTATDEVTVIFQPPAGGVVEKISGDDQGAVVGTELPQPLVVRTVSATGTPLPARPVTFQVTKSDGRLAATSGAADGALELTVLSDAQGLVQAFWTVGSDAGMGNNRVRVTSSAVGGEAFFCASAGPNPATTKINIGMGAFQVAQAGSQAPMDLNAWVNDGQNPAAGATVEFEIVAGSGFLEPIGGGQGAASLQVVTGETGRAKAVYVAGDVDEVARIEARVVGVGGLPAVFQVRTQAPDQLGTRLSGVVRDNSLLGIGGMVVRLVFDGRGEVSTVTDDEGRFAFTDLGLEGSALLVTEGETALAIGGQPIDPLALAFPQMGMHVQVAADTDNRLPMPVLLPRLDPSDQRTFDGSEAVELTVPEIEGLVVSVPADTEVRKPDGSLVDASNPIELSISPVHVDDIPMPLPDGAWAPFAWTMQPGGTTFDPPLEISLPNMAGLPAGALAYILVFDHDTNQFEIVAPGSVSEDGSLISSDPGTGIGEAGWGGFCPPYPEPTEVCKAPGTVWDAVSATAKAALSIADLFTKVSDKLQCGADLTFLTGDLITKWDDFNLDSTVTAEELNTISGLVGSAKSTAIQCVTAFVPVPSENPCKLTDQIADAVSAVNGLVNAGAATSACLQGKNTTVSDLNAISTGVLGNLSTGLQLMCDSLSPQEIAQKFACQLLEDIGVVTALQTSGPAPAPGGASVLTTEEIQQIDDLLNQLQQAVDDAESFTPTIESVLAVSGQVDTAILDLQTIDVDLKPVDSPLEGAEATLGGVVAEIDRAGGAVFSGLTATGAPLRIRFVLDSADGTKYARSSYVLPLANQSIGLDEAPAVSSQPFADTTAIESAATPPTLTSLGQTGVISTTAMLSDGTSEPAVGLADGVVYTSSAPSIVSVDANGAITANAPGSAFITVQKDGAASSVKIFVAPGDPLTTVQGIVLDASGAPVAGALVSTAAGFDVNTAADGTFQILGHTTDVDPLWVDASSGVQFGFVPAADVVPGGVTQVGVVTIDVDSDGDLVPDWHETQVYGSSPALLDSDGDGLDDGDEVLELGSDPTSVDTDADGFDDGFENAVGSNLLVADPVTTLSGTVVRPDGSPADGAEVRVLGVSEALFSATTDSTGGYLFGQPWPAGLSPVRLLAGLNTPGQTPLVGLSDATDTVPGGLTFVPEIELQATIAGMVPIAPGTFQMGSNAPGGAPYFGVSNEQPVHSVTISQPFWMGRHEVTQAEYEALMGSNPSQFFGPNRPVERVDWFDAVAYCQALTAQESALGNVPAGYEYRLPTEAEWEYACRAGTTTEFNVGDELFCSDARISGTYHPTGNFISCNNPSGTIDVGSFAPNAWGLFDMHGNVQEWCMDTFASYPAGPVTDPFVTGGSFRVLQGGSWFHGSDHSRSAFRNGAPPGLTFNEVGFRVVLAPVLVP